MTGRPIEGWNVYALEEGNVGKGEQGDDARTLSCNEQGRRVYIYNGRCAPAAAVAVYARTIEGVWVVVVAVLRVISVNIHYRVYATRWSFTESRATKGETFGADF